MIRSLPTKLVVLLSGQDDIRLGGAAYSRPLEQQFDGFHVGESLCPYQVLDGMEADSFADAGHVIRSCSARRPRLPVARRPLLLGPDHVLDEFSVPYRHGGPPRTSIGRTMPED